MHHNTPCMPAEIDQLLSGCCRRGVALQLPGRKLVSWDRAELYHIKKPTLSLDCLYKHCMIQHRLMLEANSMGRSMFYGSQRRDEDNSFCSSGTLKCRGRLRVYSRLQTDVVFRVALTFLQPLCRKPYYKVSRENKVLISFLYISLSPFQYLCCWRVVQKHHKTY